MNGDKPPDQGENPFLSAGSIIAAISTFFGFLAPLMNFWPFWVNWSVFLVAVAGGQIYLFSTLLRHWRNSKNLCKKCAAFGPVWQRFSDSILRSGDEDFLIESFCCPKVNEDETPHKLVISSKPRLDKYCILRFWADPRNGQIRALLREKPGDSNFPQLEIYFENPEVTDEEGHSSNISIRLSGRQSYQTLPDDRFLSFYLRVVPLGGTEKRPGEADLDPVALCVRLIDRYNTHWFYQKRSGEFYILKAALDKDETKWTPINIPLSFRDEENDNEPQWIGFSEDGNFRYPFREPAFDRILGLVLEFGRPNKTHRPDGGRGRVLIRGVQSGARKIE
jgi:hypothetical protein